MEVQKQQHIWITYSWKDDEAKDVTYVAQQLQQVGLSTQLDKWVLRAGHRLWEQIDEAIASEERCNAWLIVATENSLVSEACLEEVAYALNQALVVRGSSFPIIALFLGPVEPHLLPQALSTRLCVSCLDDDWKERILAAAHGRVPDIEAEMVEPYMLRVHDLSTTKFAGGPFRFAVEVRPRAGIWSPFIAGIPSAEKESVQLDISRGPRGTPTPNLTKSGPPKAEINGFWCEQANEEASPVHSYYIWCRELPTRLVFGAARADGPQFNVSLQS